MTKKSLVCLLACINLLLLAALIVGNWAPPAAHAQAVPLGANYLMVAGEVRDGTDGLYLLDLARRRMHVFVPNRDLNNRKMIHAGYRDLERDFRPGG